jgi:hypothetical protein
MACACVWRVCVCGGGYMACACVWHVHTCTQCVWPPPNTELPPPPPPPPPNTELPTNNYPQGTAVAASKYGGADMYSADMYTAFARFALSITGKPLAAWMAVEEEEVG